MVVVALLSVDLVESVDLVSVELVVNCTTQQTKRAHNLTLESVSKCMLAATSILIFPGRNSSIPVSLNDFCVFQVWLHQVSTLWRVSRGILL